TSSPPSSPPAPFSPWCCGGLSPTPSPSPSLSPPSLLPPWTCWIPAWTQPPPPLHPGDGTNADEQTAVAIASVQQAAFTDHNIQYQFRTENNGGQVAEPSSGSLAFNCVGTAEGVTYRVVQVTDSQLDGQTDATGAVSVVSTAAFTSGQQAVAQAVIQNPFSNGGSPATDAVSGEARFAYFPASTVGDATAVSVQTTDQSLTQAGGREVRRAAPPLPSSFQSGILKSGPQGAICTGAISTDQGLIRTIHLKQDCTTFNSRGFPQRLWFVNGAEKVLGGPLFPPELEFPEFHNPGNVVLRRIGGRPTTPFEVVVQGSPSPHFILAVTIFEAVFKYLKGFHMGDGASLFSPLEEGRARTNGFMLQEGRFRLNTERAV
uniref:Upstream transcription factor 2, c-fos interacting n=1 Tax=Podarcis muralis TaxID=64176 RepID=A0A670II14_PODMU